jgi:ubiquinone/menaquinone biosynthesis C-methylase UbiE
MTYEDSSLYLAELLSGYQKSIVLMVANRLDLFTALGEDKAAAKDLAERLSTNPDATARLADALVALGLLMKSEGKYRNAPIGREFLIRGAPKYQGDIIRHHENCHENWSRLADVVQKGRPIEESGKPRTPSDTDAFIRGMANIAHGSGKELAESLDLRGVKRVLDVGGGPGVYAIEMLRLLPEAQGVVLDLKEPLRIAAEFVENAGMKERIELREGDLTEVDFGEGFDLVLISNIIHSFTPDENESLFARVARCLSPTGRLVVKDFLMNEDRSGPVFPALFAINMLVGRSCGTAYTNSDIHDWLKEAGLAPVQRFTIARHSHVIVAAK